MSERQPTSAGVPCTVYTHAQEVMPGLYWLASIDVPALNLQAAALLLNVSTGQLLLRAGCGCAVSVSFSAQCLELAATVQRSHQQHRGGLH